MRLVAGAFGGFGDAGAGLSALASGEAVLLPWAWKASVAPFRAAARAAFPDVTGFNVEVGDEADEMDVAPRLCVGIPCVCMSPSDAETGASVVVGDGLQRFTSASK